MKKPRSKTVLIQELFREAMRPTDKLRGGFGARIRRQQALMLEAARLLSIWGPHREKRQIDIFDERDAA